MILIVRADDGSLISCKLCLSVLMEEHLPWFCSGFLFLLNFQWLVARTMLLCFTYYTCCCNSFKNSRTRQEQLWKYCCGYKVAMRHVALSRTSLLRCALRERGFLFSATTEDVVVLFVCAHSEGGDMSSWDEAKDFLENFVVLL